MPDTTAPPAALESARTRSRLASLGFLGCLVLAGLIMAWRYVGFQASDDANYLAAGLHWLEHFPYVGNSHWTLRHPIALPIAASVAVLGVREFAVSLPAILYFVATLAVNVFFVSRFIGLGPALGGTLLMTTFPGFVVLATYMNADLVELFYMTVAFWTFVDAVEHPARRWSLLLSGAAGAVGFLTRETSAAFVIFAGIMFLFWPAMPRRNYFILAAGFVAVLGAEWLYLTAMTGNPLYRLRIDEHHDTINRAGEVARTRERGGMIDAEGNVSVSVWLDPILSLLVTQKYGLLFWAAIPAVFFLWRERPASPIRARALRLMLLFAVVWFVFVDLNPKLYLVPRYIVVTASLFTMAVAWWLVEAWHRGRRLLVGMTVAALLGVNLLGLMVENTNPRFAERALVDFVAANPGQIVYTDAETEIRADFFLRFRGMDESRVSREAPGPNALIFYNGEPMARCARSVRCRKDLAAYAPNPSWQEIERLDIPRSAAARVIEAFSLQRFLPAEVARKIMQPVGAVVLYRVSAPTPERNGR